MGSAGRVIAQCLVAAGSVWVGASLCGYYLSLGGIERHNLETSWMWLLAVLWVYAYVTGSTKSQLASPQSNPPVAWVSLCLVAASFWLYAPSLTIGLLSDDFVLVDRITTGAFWSLQKAEFFRPAPHLLWAATFEIVGHQALYLHILNVLIHAINSSLVVVIATRLGFDRLLAILAGVLFLTIPSNVEPVAWASGIQDVLMTLGCLAFVVGASRGPSLSVMFLALSGLVVGLLTKETAVMAPVLASVLWLRVGPFRKTPGWAVIAGGVVLSIGYGVWRLTATAVPTDYTVAPSRYFLKEFLVRPFATLAVPWSGATLDSAPALGLISAGLILVVAVMAAAGRPSRVGFWTVNRCGLWVIASVMPVYAYLFISDSMQGSRYLYLGSVGWILLLIQITQTSFHHHVRGGRAATLLLLSGLTAMWAVGTRQLLNPWVQAADLRDRVISSAIEQIQTTPCQSAIFAQLPDSLDGAYVFRNGFWGALSQATDTMDLELNRLPPISADCQFRWSGTDFIARLN